MRYLFLKTAITWQFVVSFCTICWANCEFSVQIIWLAIWLKALWCYLQYNFSSLLELRPSIYDIFQDGTVHQRKGALRRCVSFSRRGWCTSFGIAEKLVWSVVKMLWNDSWGGRSKWRKGEVEGKVRRVKGGIEGWREQKCYSEQFENSASLRSTSYDYPAPSWITFFLIKMNVTKHLPSSFAALHSRPLHHLNITFKQSLTRRHIAQLKIPGRPAFTSLFRNWNKFFIVI